MTSIGIFGDSVAKGVVFDAVKNKYSLIKESFVNIMGRQHNLSIKNYSKFGCTIPVGSEILKRHVSELGKFNYTLLEFGGNDCDYNWAEVSKKPDQEHLCNTPITIFCEKYEGLINFILKNGGRPILLNLPPIDPKRYFHWITKEHHKINILTFLGEIDSIYKWQEMYSIAIEKLSIEMKIPLIDIRSGFLSKDNYSDYLCSDGIHPNEKGHLLIFKALQKRVEKGLIL